MRSLRSQNWLDVRLWGRKQDQDAEFTGNPMIDRKLFTFRSKRRPATLGSRWNDGSPAYSVRIHSRTRPLGARNLPIKLLSLSLKQTYRPMQMLFKPKQMM
ncbi:predicted protein [Coccidioides posadasii str. Silveira]|uniref:Predicted protein n=1 Tax=Coccidioides posadasii (strain RMSCC 757 / Silveira) TaxID=443226 RepID=E9D670_COCPS|nr:predicted protein [Coccidioides posadasii str. Silveira]